MDKDPLIGTSLGHFQIQRRIAVGGMGVIYHATHSVIGRTAAIKVLSGDYSSDKSMIKRLHMEARAVNQIGHPNIIDIFDFGQTPDGREFFIMEYLDGRSLAQILEQQPRLPWTMTGPIMTQLLDALAAAHDHGIVHRDIKPENIIVTQLDDGQILTKVLDFGIAKPMVMGPEGERLTRAGVVLGTPEYIAPEQIRGREVDGRADLYSAGVILFELIMGKRPFEADEVINLLMAHLKEPVPSMEGILPEQQIPLFVPAVVNRAMAKNPDQRFPDARTFARALELETSAVAPTDGTRPLPQMMWEQDQGSRRGGTLPMPQPTTPGIGPASHGRPHGQAMPTAPLRGSPSIPVTGIPTAPGTQMPTQLLQDTPRRGLPVALIVALALVVLGGAGAILYFAALRPGPGPGATKPVVGKPARSDAAAPKAPEEIDLQLLYQQVRRTLRQGTRNVSVEVRRTCIRGIGKLRDDDAFALLTSILRDDPDGIVRSAAALAIADIGDPAGVTALREVRAQSSDAMKVWIDEALMRLGTPEGRIGLRDALRSRSKDVRFQAALALGEAGDKAAVPELKDVAKQNAATMDRETSIAVLGTLARLDHKESYASLVKVLNQSDKVIKLGAAEVLAKLGHEEALTTLKTLLKSDDRTSQLVAAKILAALGDFSGLDPLTEGCKAKDVATRRLAVEGLGSIGDKAALPPLAKAIEDLNWDVKSTSAEALAKILSLMPSALVRRSQDWIKTALANRDWSVRHAAVGVTSEMDPELAMSLLGWAFTDKDPRVRAAAVAMLARLHKQEALPLLRRALADPSDIVRVQAARGLGELGGKEVDKELHDSVRDKSPIVGMEIAGALLARGDSSYVNDLKQAARAKDPDLRQAAVNALGKWKHADSDKLLLTALTDRAPAVRLAAAYQLARRKNAAGADELRKAARGGGPEAGRAVEGLAALGLKPTAEVQALAASNTSDDRRQAAGSAHLIAPAAAITVLSRTARDPEVDVRLAAALSLTRMAATSSESVPILRRLARDHSPAVRAQANIGLARARKAHSALSALDKQEVKPVETAPLPPPPKPKPKVVIPRDQLKQPLFVNINSPQQLYMYYLSRATVHTDRGQYAAALRSLNMAQRQKSTIQVLCEFGFLYHRMALDNVRRGNAKGARKPLITARNYYKQCKAKAPAGPQRTRAERGLRDIERTLTLTR